MATYSEAIYWLALINDNKLRLNLVKPMILRWRLQEKRSLAELFELSPLDLSATFGLSDEEAERVSSAAERLETQAAALKGWQAQGIELVTRIDPEYPRRLIHTLPLARQPLVLWTRGPLNLLNRPGVTMLGNQEPDKATTKFIDELMTTLEAEGIGLISGYGRGLDRVTFEAMLAKPNGFTVTLLPLGLAAFAKTTTRLDESVASGRTLLVSPFAPEMAYNEKLAEARNLLIDHLTLALLVPESDEETFPRARAALERGVTVFVKANTARNRDLLDLGALLLTDSGEVVDWVQQAVVDTALQEADEEEVSREAPVVISAPASIPTLTPAPASAPTPAPAPAEGDDYSLRYEEAPLLDSDEAMEILSMGGEIPEILRNRLKKPKRGERKKTK
jgi:predicted Rossmann fold nucleotide-binding protein DprA/Smf involved in DNA uptake